MKQILFFLFGLVIFIVGCEKVTIENAEQKLQQLLDQKVEEDDDLHNAFLLVHSDKLGIHWNLASGEIETNKEPITKNHPFHIASIGKTFTSVLISILYEKGLIDYDDTINKYLPDEIINNLHIYQNEIYSDKILVRHLLNHTSGLPDYFTEKPKQGKNILDLIKEDKSHFWTPQETIDWVKNNLQPHFPPGEEFHYSDTGYQLLGLIIEKITGRSLAKELHKNIFQPLGMKNTYQLFYSEPEQKSEYPMANVYLDTVEISQFRSISADWAGGGIVSTTEDLLLFIKALKNNTLIKEETFERMKNWTKIERGIYYGYGLMRFQFRELFFLLSNDLNVWGNSGSIGSYMYYNPKHEIYVIGNFNQIKYEEKHVRFMIKILSMLLKL